MDVLESLVHQTAVATLVAVLGGAVDQLLLGQRDQATSLAEPLTFQRAGGRERPARAALTLVLHCTITKFPDCTNHVTLP